MASSTGDVRVGVDIGGTFTDIVLLGADGTIHTKKISSSVGDYARAIVEGLSELFVETGLAGEAIEEIRHGTTVASNAILEHKGARVGLITTQGFRDVLEIRTLRMPRLYDLAWEKPAPLVERYLRQSTWAPDPVLTRPGFEALQSILLTGGFIKRPHRFEDLVDVEIARQAAGY